MKRVLKIAGVVLGVAAVAFIIACAVGIWQDNHPPKPNPEEQARLDAQRQERIQVRGARRQAFQESVLHHNAMEYVEAVVKEIYPDSECQVEIDAGEYYLEEDRNLADIPADQEGWSRFFQRVNLWVKVNWWDFAEDNREVMEGMIAHGLTGWLQNQYGGSPEWYFDAVTGQITFTPTPGV